MPQAHGIDPGRLSIGGDSAGAHLALAATLRLRRRRPGIVKFMLLYYGLYGLRDSRSRRRFADPVYGLTPAELRFYEACYLGSDTSPDPDAIDLLSADLSGLPASLHRGCGSRSLARRQLGPVGRPDEGWRSAELRIYDGVLHGFLHWSRLVPTATQALEDGARALRDGVLKLPS